jgi:hypothetical protein
MSTAGDAELTDRITRTCQIIIGALVVGVLFFLGIAASIDLGTSRPVGPGAVAGQPAARQDGKPEAIRRPDANANPNAGGFWDAFVSGPFLTYTAIAFAAIMLPLSLVVPGTIVAQNRRALAAGKSTVSPPQGIGTETPATETGRLAMIYQQQLILGAALNEGPAFCAAAAYLIEKSPIALGLAMLLVVGLILRFPTRRRVELWIDQQREKLILDRQAGV